VLPIAQQHQMILLSVLDENERAVVHAALMKMIAAAERFETLRSADPETGTVNDLRVVAVDDRLEKLQR
jgi:hypothetical protein